VTRRHKSILPIAAMLIIFGVGTEATAGPTDDPFAKDKSVFYSDKVLHGALNDIAQMQEPELRAFARYLAECDDQGESDVAKHGCSAALMNYEVEFGASSLAHARFLDDLVYARASLAARSPSEKARDVNVNNMNVNDMGQKFAEQAAKDAKVFSALQEATRDRFRSLKALQR
jgi:hypothetical protein